MRDLLTQQEINNGNGQLPSQAGGDYGHTIIHDPNDGLDGIGDGLRLTCQMNRERSKHFAPTGDKGNNGGDNAAQNTRRNGRDRKGALNFASLNMKGGGSTSTSNKWLEICQLMREEKIDVLAIQETHLSEQKKEELNQIFERQIHIMSSIDRTKPNAMGVAFVLKKSTTKWKETKFRELIPGRAVYIEIPWQKEKPLGCLNVYAPNNHTSNKSFWNKLKANWNVRPHLLEPSILLGDLNMVEEAIDRIPAHPDPMEVTKALSALKSHLSLVDGWRRENQSTIDFSFHMTN